MNCFLGCGLCGDCQDNSTKVRIGESPYYDANYLRHVPSSENRMAGLEIIIVNPLTQRTG